MKFYRKRRKLLPEIPKTAAQAAENIPTQPCAALFYKYVVAPSAQGEALIFYIPELLEYMALAEEWNADSTYYVCPSPFYQLLTIGFMRDGYVSLAINI